MSQTYCLIASYVARREIVSRASLQMSVENRSLYILDLKSKTYIYKNKYIFSP